MTGSPIRSRGSRVHHAPTVLAPALALTGRLLGCSGQPLATGQFTLAPKPPDAARPEGRMVSATLDRERRLSVQLERGLSR